MVVDLTSAENNEPGELAAIRRSDAVGHSETCIANVQPKSLGPAAAAALQATKRKLPESFRKPPVPKRKSAVVEPRPTSHTTAPSLAPSVTRIAARGPPATAPDSQQLHQQKTQAAASPGNTSCQPVLQSRPKEPGSPLASTDVLDLSSLQSAASQQPKAPRRLPGSLAVPVPVPSDLKSSCIRNSAAPLSKAGPSEHDTKVRIWRQVNLLHHVLQSHACS